MSSTLLPIRFRVFLDYGAGLCLVAFLAWSSQAIGATIVLNGDDQIGETSFDSGLHWSDAQAPATGDDYITGDFRLRTPPDGNSHTFGGDSLTINNTNGYSWGLMYKGAGTSGVILIDGLILDGGMISHANGTGDLCQIDGNILVSSASTIYAKQGSIDILADISGSGDLYIPQTDAPGSTQRTVTFLNTNSGFSGSLDVDGRFRLDDAASLTFVIGSNGVNNEVSGGGNAVLDGTFTLDLTGAGTNPGDAWTLVSTDSPSYGPTFNIPGFTELAPGVWDGTDYWYDASTGVLAYGEPPALVGVYLNVGGDSIGTSSFDNDGANNWEDGLDPSPGDDYVVTVEFLRSPPDSLNYTFQGDTLTLRSGGGMISKHSGDRTLTADWIMDGGYIRSGSGDGIEETLAGNMEVTANGGEIRADQTPYLISAAISGSAGTLSLTAGYTITIAGTNTFTGDVNASGSNLVWQNGSEWPFVIGPSGVNNQIAGVGSAFFDGTFVFDLTGASSISGDSWTVVGTASQSYGANFSITGFSEDAPGRWNDGTYWFNEATGKLTVGPPPQPSTLLPIVTLTDTTDAPNGAWSWFEDERCIVDGDAPNGPRLLVSSVSSAPDGDPESGDIDLTWLNFVDGTTGNFEFANRLQRDDHDSAALWVRPDGRYLAVYSRHTSDQLTRWRVSTNPYDPTGWNAEQTYTQSSNTTYNNLHYLPNDGGGAGVLYNFSRILNWDPTVMTSSDHGSTWSSGGKLMTRGNSSDRPYVRYFSDGDRVHFITTEEHPRDFDNSIYHGYVQDGVSYDSDGNVVDANIFDSSGPQPTAFTRVFTTGDTYDGVPMRRAWTTDVAIDGGDPVILFTARANGSTSDHRFFYARYDAVIGWTVHKLAKAGGYLYGAEQDYTGLGAIDPDEPDVVVISTNMDPRTDESTAKYELYQGRTTDGGASWAWIALTENSEVDNLRPLIPAFPDGYERVLVWMRGTYNSYQSWNTEAVVMRETLAERVNWDCISGPGNTTRPATCSPAQFASLDADQDGDVDLGDVAQFHEGYVELSTLVDLPSRSEVMASAYAVASHWIDGHRYPGHNRWDRATCFEGIMGLYRQFPEQAWYDYSELWAEIHNWQLNGGSSTRNADNQTAGQVYLDLYGYDPQPVRIAEIQASIDNMVASPQSDDWWWIDAIQMALPTFAAFGKLYDDEDYYNKGWDLFHHTYAIEGDNGLYADNGDHAYGDYLWWRDAGFQPPTTSPNGEMVYWSRGNGWVVAGLARALSHMKPTDPHYNDYVQVFQEMSASLILRQQSNGFWPVNLADPDHAFSVNPFFVDSPETSGTAFFTYGLAWGIRNGYLDAAVYGPAVVRAWDALTTTSVDERGRLGWCQSVGAEPTSSQPIDEYNMTDFCVGAFLLAASEVVQLADGPLPAPGDISPPSGEGWWAHNGFVDGNYDLGSGNTGQITVEYDIVPYSTFGIDAVMAYADSDTNVTAYGDNFALVRLVDGAFDAYDTFGYDADVVVPYEPGALHHVRLDIDLPAQTYDVWITPPGGSPTQIADDYGFRFTAGTPDDLGQATLISASKPGDFVVYHHTVTPP